MFQNRAIVIFSCIMLLCASGAYAADGKALLDAKCGKCHNGRIVKIDPGMYTAQQWQRFFDKNRHEVFCDLNSRFTPEELKAVQAYLMNPSATPLPPAAPGTPPVK